MSSHSPVNASFNCRHCRNCAIDMRADLGLTSDWTASPTVVDSDIQTPMDLLDTLEDIAAAAVEAIVMQFYHSELRYDPPPKSHSRGHQDRLALDLHGWHRQYCAIRDIQERDERIEEQRARIDALEMEVMHLKQDQVKTASFHEEQDVVATQQLDDIYQLILDMEHDVKASESTRIELNAKHAEERENYLALEAALEAERQAIFKYRDNLLQATRASGLRGHKMEEQWLCNEFRAIRDDVDFLRAEINTVKANAQAIHVLADEKNMLRVHVQTLERQLRRYQLLAVEDQRIAVSDIACIAADRDRDRRIVDQYARRLQGLEDVHSSRSHIDDFAMELRSDDTKTTVPSAKSSDLQEGTATYCSPSMTLVDTLTLDRDLLQEQGTKIENEKATGEPRKARLEEKFHGVNRRRRDAHEKYCSKLTVMRATIVKLTCRRDAVIDGREHSDATSVDISSQVVLDKTASGTVQRFRRPHKRTTTIKASMVTQQDQQDLRKASETAKLGGSGSVIDTDSDVVTVASSADGWMCNGEHSFHSDDLRGTSTSPVAGDSRNYGNGSLESTCPALMVTPYDAVPEPDESLGDVSLSSAPCSPYMHPDIDTPGFWRRRATTTVGLAVTLDYPGCTDGQLFTSSPQGFPYHPQISVADFPGWLDLVKEIGYKYTSKCGRIVDLSAHNIRNEQAIRAASVVRDSSNHGLLPPSWSALRAFEPP